MTEILAFFLCYVPQLVDNFQIQNLLEQLQQLIQLIFMNCWLLQNIFKQMQLQKIECLNRSPTTVLI